MFKKDKKQPEETLQKVLERKEREKVQKAMQEVESKLPSLAYDVFETRDPVTKARVFKMAVIKYNPETKEAVVNKIVNVNNEVVALRTQIDKESLSTLFDKENRK